MNVIFIKKLNLKQTYNLSLKLFKNKIESRRVWRPLNLQKHLKKFEKYKILNAKKIYESSLCLPSDDNISSADVDKISNYIKKLHKNIYNK